MTLRPPLKELQNKITFEKTFKVKRHRHVNINNAFKILKDHNERVAKINGLLKKHISSKKGPSSNRCKCVSSFN
jgi:hypothetical protein